jgi:hypothetical protein
MANEGTRTRRLTPGKRLVRLLNKGLAAGCEWDEAEQTTLQLIADSEDRRAALAGLFDVEVAKPAPSTRRVVEVAGELRALEASISKMIGALKFDPDAAVQPTKSPRHVTAATGWDARSHRQVPVTTRPGA